MTRRHDSSTPELGARRTGISRRGGRVLILAVAVLLAVGGLNYMDLSGDGATAAADHVCAFGEPGGYQVPIYDEHGVILEIVWMCPDDPGTTTTTTVPHTGTFVDDDASVFEDDIEWMAAEGITKGCNPPVNDRFCPDAAMTRGQMAAFLVRALSLTDRLDDPFMDDDDSIFEADIERLAAADITRSCNPPTRDRYCPDARVTRGQMAAFLVRAIGYTDNGGGDLFIDDDDSIFEGDIDRLGTAGVTRGCDPPINSRFCPTGPVTRGQMAAFMHRALG